MKQGWARAGLLGAMLAAAGCTGAPGFTPVYGVREAGPADVAACRYISDFRMQPGVYGPFASQGLKYARNSIMNDALNAGADTIVFDQATPGVDIYELHAKAYDC